MLLTDLVDTSAAVAATRSRRTKADLIAGLLDPDRDAGRDADRGDVPVRRAAAAPYRGRLAQSDAGAGPGRGAERWTSTDVDTAFATVSEISGTGSQAKRRAVMDDLFGRATADEQRFLRLLVGGELRQGALDGVMADAVATATGISLAKIRTATMLRGRRGTGRGGGAAGR